jgi:branched-chain amino acid transport system ATP-binding protein
VTRIAQRIAVLDFGCKITEGTPDEIKRHPDVIAAYLGTDEVGHA